MIVMNDEMRWNEDDRSSSTAHRPGGLRSLGATQLGGLASGGYVHETRIPDEDNVQTCLNCKRPKCSGSCRDVSGFKGKRKGGGHSDAKK
jgi:hypothetical protein